MHAMFNLKQSKLHCLPHLWVYVTTQSRLARASVRLNQIIWSNTSMVLVMGSGMCCTNFLTLFIFFFYCNLWNRICYCFLYTESITQWYNIIIALNGHSNRSHFFLRLLFPFIYTDSSTLLVESLAGRNIRGVKLSRKQMVKHTRKQMVATAFISV